ncbi:MAG TPA: efflux RND transporter periplasmic adaptor subunit [Hyphomicrobiales bacterium]|nr:efflux RND transporter periplasmic adaptor subunit [Hyphomicrobiales bacterium]
MRKVWWIVVVLALVAAGFGYEHWHPGTFARLTGGAAEAQTARTGSGAATRPGPNARSPAQPGRRLATAVITVPATKGDFPVIRTAIGWVQPLAVVNLKPRIDGEIIAQHATDGQDVKAGEVLFQLDDRAAKAAVARDEAALAKDQATEVRTQGDLKRAQLLVQKAAGTQQALDQAVADAKSATAQVAADQATLDADKLTLSYTTIKSPIDGRLGAVQVTPGNLVKGNDPNTTLVTITQMKPVRVSFSLPDNDVDALRVALHAKPPTPVKIFLQGSAAPVATGMLDFVDSTVDTTSATINARATVKNDDLALWPGEYVQVSLPLGTVHNATLVPAVAIQPAQQGSLVYVVKPDKTVAVRPVTVALVQNGEAAITAGLKPGEHVVVEGQLHLAEGSRVNEHVDATQAVGGGEAHS